MTTATMTEIADDLAAILGNSYLVKRSITRGWIDVRLNPAVALRDNLDFLRVTVDDETFRLTHLTHNEVVKGEASLSGALSAYLVALVNEWCETTF